MADVTVSEFGTVRLKRALENPRRALGRIGARLQNESAQAFNNQGLGEIAWSLPYDGAEPFINVAATLGDFAAGLKKPRNRVFRRAALRQSGDLSKSIEYNVLDDKTVEVGSGLPYAGLHQRGGKSVVRITKAGQIALAKWLKSKAGKPYTDRLGAFVTRQRHEIRVQPRPFIGITDDARADITEIVESEIANEADA